MNSTAENVLVFGAGGIGGYIAGKLGHLSVSLSVTARGAHLTAIKEHGLTLINPQGDHVTVIPAVITDNPADLPPPDICFLCVKGYDLPDAIEQLKPVISSDTILIPLLNGADIYERVRASLHSGVVLPGCIYIGSSIQKPGVVHHTGGTGKLLFGTDPNRPEVYPEKLFDLLTRAGIPYKWHADPTPAIWTKYLFIASFALVTGTSGKTIGEVLEDKKSKETVISIMQEILGIAKTRGIVLDSDIVETSLETAASFPKEAKTSFQRDIEQNKPRHEGDLFGGTILRLAETMGVKAPVTRRVYRLIKQ